MLHCLCSELGHEVYYWQDGKGPCSPVQDALSPTAEGDVEEEDEAGGGPILYMRSFGRWVSDLGGTNTDNPDNWGIISFTAAMLSCE
jgi:hypothetical protein